MYNGELLGENSWWKLLPTNQGGKLIGLPPDVWRAGGAIDSPSVIILEPVGWILDW